MITSEQIRNNFKLPKFIRNNELFKKPFSFDKIFPSIGLENSSLELQDTKWMAPFLIKNGIKGMSASFIENFDNWWKKAAYYALTPLMYSVLIIDYIQAKRIKRHLKKYRYNIVFSASGMDGVWDIITMSMRGIRSCQSWDASRNKQLIGSVIDPGCGIIYLTDGNNHTGYGTDMLHRAVVRYAVHQRLGPCLFMEQLYSKEHTSDTDINALNAIFANFLYSKTKLPILYDFCVSDYKSVAEQTFVPAPPHITYGNYHLMSYRDSNIPYHNIEPQDIQQFPELKKVQHFWGT